MTNRTPPPIFLLKIFNWGWYDIFFCCYYWVSLSMVVFFSFRILNVSNGWIHGSQRLDLCTSMDKSDSSKFLHLCTYMDYLIKIFLFWGVCSNIMGVSSLFNLCTCMFSEVRVNVNYVRGIVEIGNWCWLELWVLCFSN